MAFDSILSWLFRKRVKQIEMFKDNPVETQDELLASLIYKARYTEWGKKHDYEHIRSLSEFKKRVPLQDYEGVKPYVERLKKGEQNLLWPTEINWFAQSSGTTTDRSKFIPVSREALEDCHYKGGKDMVALYYEKHPSSKLYSGKNLVMGGSAQINSLRENSYVGDLSSIIINNLPFWVEIRRTPGKDVALMDDWEKKIERMARETMREDVTSIAGVPSWTLVLFKRILEVSGKDNILEIWPNLELFMHGGVSFAPYRDKFESLIPSDDMSYLENYNASEGFFGIQDREDAADMLLMLDYGIFYEFLPMEELEKEDPETISLSEVETGTNYAIVISSNAGLWRYLVGDTIQFTSRFPFRIQVTGRTKYFINTFGEEVIMDNAIKALKVACEKNNCEVAEYTAGPIYMSEEHQGGHEWLIEFEEEPEDLASFARDLDQALREVNSDYDAKRTNDLTLNLPTVRKMPEGAFYQWMKKKGKLGGQNKVPRLSNDRKHIEDVLSVASPVVNFPE